MAWDYPIGVVAPANFALHVNRYLHESPATREHLAMVAVKNHHNGVSNPMAQLRYEITVEEVLNAPIVVEPFGISTARLRAMAPPRCCSWARRSSIGTPTGRCGSAGSGSGSTG